MTIVSHQAASEILAEMARTSRIFRISGQHASGDEPSGTKLGFLQILALGSARPSDLATRLVVSMPVASRAIDSLEADGLVARERDPDDGRAVILSITERGREVLADGESTAVDAFAACLADISAAEGSTVRTLLQRLNSHLAEVMGVPERAADSRRVRSGEPLAHDRTAAETAGEKTER